MEITRILLGDSTSRVIVSTLREAWGVKSLIEEGLVNEVFPRPRVYPESSHDILGTFWNTNRSFGSPRTRHSGQVCLNCSHN